MVKTLRAGLLLAWLGAVAVLAPAAAQSPVTADAAARDRTSYVVGMDVGQSLKPIGPDLDLASFERAIGHALSGGAPLLTPEEGQAISRALTQRIAFRGGRPVPGLPPGSEPPAVDPAQVGLLVGADMGRQLASMRDDLDIAALVRGVRAIVEGGTPEIAETEVEGIRQSMQDRARLRAAGAADANRQAGAAFLAANRGKPGVFATASGIQYSVEKQGLGPRPRATDRVRVHYRGTLLDGTEFDSSYARNAPAVFGLGDVIAGWTEGLQLMPIGGKYRFWIPGDLAYGPKGSPPNIPPNSTLIFDVELIDIL
ncbi:MULTISPECIES: FKBP-type peptidyl-prolyl cis-trans isomerase [Luteimonas]|uniref:FKBP-type peptidyl-prolyl cis-trans isomerase n=1 Tax=Luteimonas TaxID=83614 RepID=UPI000C7C14FC|nr:MULTISPECIES: FKBP-type peptidyl-prolyl cis-trans isomerase [Luteimonas]